MKFGKEFSSQMVPEWQEAYMDYNNLKSLLKNVQTYKRNVRPAYSPSGITRKLSLYRAFSGLTQRKSHVRSPTPSPDVEMPPIVVNSNVRSHGEDYETRFLMTADEGGEYELVYFRRLDDEFNKVNKFYKSKVDEVVKEAELLNTQMDAFIAFRIRVENNQGPFDRSAELNRLASDIAVSSAAMSASTPAGARANRRVDLMDIIEEGPSIHGDQMDESTDSDKNEATETGMTSREQVHKPKKGSVDLRPAPLDILNKVTFHNNLETPRSTIKEVLNVPNRTELVFSRRNLRKVENKLKVAFIEFYQKLRLLKSYSFMNTLAFSKIMKKYDKITTRNASKSYLSMVDTSFLGSSDDVTKLMERVEKTFIKHFCNSNRTKGINILRPKDKREKHRTSFSVGFFAGGTVAFIVALVFIVRAHKILESPGQTKYMETLFPLYSLFAFMILHIIMYAINIFYWRRYRVNHSFIFGFKQGAELSYREVFLLAFVLAVITLATVLSNLDMEMNPTTKEYNAFSELLPLLIVVVLIVILICPFNIIHRPSRYFFLTCVFHCICAPFYKVTLPDFFLADQMTSQVQAIRSLEFYICYYGFGDYKHREHKCNKDSQVFEVFFFIVAVIPYWSRFLQCLRRLFEEKDAMQGYNGLKYFSTIVAVCLRTAYSFYGGIAWKVAAAAVSVLSAVVCTYWDLVLDWGLLQRDSKNRWLRDKLLVPQKNIYFAAMGLNVLLRFAWIQTVLNFQFTFMHKNTLTTVVACLEIIRRGIWNFFRLENEHLNNVGKYRAFKSVPLPFNYDEDGDKDE